MTSTNSTILKLTVNNHAAVLSHISGLFARRSYNLEGVMVRPIKIGAANNIENLSRMWLLINEGDRLQQIISQTEKLHDVISVERHDFEGSVFAHTEDFFIDRTIECKIY